MPALISYRIPARIAPRLGLGPDFPTDGSQFDHLFAGTARTDFPGGDAGRLYDSIQQLYALPGSTRLFMCHVYTEQGQAPQFESPLDAQRQGNIHLRADTSRDAYIALRTARDRTLAAPALMIPALRVNICAGALDGALNPEQNE